MPNLQLHTGIANVTADGAGNLNVNVQVGGGGGGGSNVTIVGQTLTLAVEDAADGIIGSPVVADAIQIGFKDASGNLQIPSTANPLPVSLTGSFTNLSVGLTGTTAPTSATEIGIIVGGNLVGVSAANPLPISGSISATNPSVGVTGAAVPADATFIGGSDGTNLQALLVESATHQNLRVGIYNGATEVTVTGANALKVDGSAVTQPVSIAATVNVGLVSVGGTAIALGLAVSASSVPVVIASDQVAVAVKPGAGSTFNENLTQINGSSISSAASGVQKVGIVGSAGAVLDGTAGSPSTGVLTIQGVSGGTAIPVSIGATVTVSVSGTVAVTQSGSWTVGLSAGSALVGGVEIYDGAGTNKLAVNASGQIAISNFPATQPVSGTVTANQGTAGSAWPVTLTSTTITGTVAVTESGTWTVRVVGNAGGLFDAVATGAAVPTNAIQVGAAAATALPTAVTGGQLVAPMADKFGRQVVVQNTVRNLVGTASLDSSSSSSTTLIAAGATGVFNDIISLVITNDSSTATIVSLSDGTTTYKFAIAANGGAVMNFATPLPAASSATAWTVLNSAAVSLHYTAIYAQNK